jgi:hypothetical protein
MATAAFYVPGNADLTMRFVNHTPLPGVLIPCAEAGDEMTSLVVCAVTFAITPSSSGNVPEGQTLALAPVQRPVEVGFQKPTPADDHFVRAGVSVTAAGFVHAPGGKATKADASLVVGEEKRVVRAFGPRVWRDGMFGVLSATAPLAFDRVPMRWDLAYGGTLLRKASTTKYQGRDYIVPEHPAGFPQNLEGTGFYLDREGAVDKPLPQLEHPDVPIRAWEDRPAPVCLAPYPLRGGMRPLALVRDDEKVDLNRIGRLTAPAAPWLVFPEVPARTPIVLRGMRPRGEALAFQVPECPVSVRAILGPARFHLPMRLDAVDIDAEAAEVRFVFRVAFTYALIRYELREAYLEPTDHFPALPPPGRRARGPQSMP